MRCNLVDVVSHVIAHAENLSVHGLQSFLELDQARLRKATAAKVSKISRDSIPEPSVHATWLMTDFRCLALDHLLVFALFAVLQLSSLSLWPRHNQTRAQHARSVN